MRNKTMYFWINGVVYLWLGLSSVIAQNVSPVVPPSDEKNVTGLIYFFVQAVQQQDVTALQHMLDKTVCNNNGKQWKREAATIIFTEFFARTMQRMGDDRWHGQTPPGVTSSTWDLAVYSPAVVLVNDTTAQVTFKFNWISGIPFARNTTDPLLTWPAQKVQDTWIFIKKGRWWKVRQLGTFWDVMLTLNTLKKE